MIQNFEHMRGKNISEPHLYGQYGKSIITAECTCILSQRSKHKVTKVNSAVNVEVHQDQ